MRSMTAYVVHEGLRIGESRGLWTSLHLGRLDTETLQVNIDGFWQPMTFGTVVHMLGRDTIEFRGKDIFGPQAEQVVQGPFPPKLFVDAEAVIVAYMKGKMGFTPDTAFKAASSAPFDKELVELCVRMLIGGPGALREACRTANPTSYKATWAFYVEEMQRRDAADIAVDARAMLGNKVWKPSLAKVPVEVLDLTGDDD